jgi:hypothetical protein
VIAAPQPQVPCVRKETFHSIRKCGAIRCLHCRGILRGRNGQVNESRGLYALRAKCYRRALSCLCGCSNFTSMRRAAHRWGMEAGACARALNGGTARSRNPFFIPRESGFQGWYFARAGRESVRTIRARNRLWLPRNSRVLSRLVMRAGVQWEQVRSPVVSLAV